MTEKGPKFSNGLGGILREIVEDFSNIIIELQIDGRLLYISPQIEDLFGYSYQELVNRPLYNYVHHEDLELVVNTLKKAMKNEVIFTLNEFRIRHKDGSYRTVSGRGKLIGSGKERRLLSIITDITEQKQTAANLRASEEQYRLIAENMDDMVAIFDQKMRLLYINEGQQTISGFTHDEVINKSALEFIHPDDIERTAKLFQRAWQSGSGIAEYRIRHKNGTYIWLETRGKIIINSDGEKQAILTSRNIDARKKIEQALKKSEKKYRLISESANDLIAILKIRHLLWFKIPIFIYEYVNESAHQRVLGYSHSDLINHPLERVIDASDMERSVRTFLKVFNEGRGSAEVRLKTKDGNFVWIDFELIKLTPGAGTTKILLVGRDVTEKRKLLTELHQKNTELEKLSQSRDEFYSGLSHDIRSPISNINLSAELISRSNNLDAEQIEYLQIIQKNAALLEHLTRELMEYSRLKSGEIPLQENIFRLSEIISELMVELEPRIKEKGLIIKENYMTDPAIVLDRIQIAKILRNLFENAIKYSYPGGQIIISSKIQEGLWTCSITDFGCGIAPENLSRLFSPFQRFNEADQMNHKGFGIGLMVCKRIIDLYKGTIWAESEGLTKGTTFYFQINLNRSL